jgi:hypothetical protein
MLTGATTTLLHTLVTTTATVFTVTTVQMTGVQLGAGSVLPTTNLNLTTTYLATLTVKPKWTVSGSAIQAGLMEMLVS